MTTYCTVPRGEQRGDPTRGALDGQDRAGSRGAVCRSQIIRWDEWRARAITTDQHRLLAFFDLAALRRRRVAQ